MPGPCRSISLATSLLWASLWISSGTPPCAGDDEWAVASPCEAIAFSCDDTRLAIRRIEAVGDGPSGLSALGSPGDIVLSNGLVTAVIEALAHPH